MLIRQEKALIKLCFLYCRLSEKEQEAFSLAPLEGWRTIPWIRDRIEKISFFKVEALDASGLDYLELFLRNRKGSLT